jgi:hypothetical protein
MLPIPEWNNITPTRYPHLTPTNNHTPTYREAAHSYIEHTAITTKAPHTHTYHVSDKYIDTVHHITE